MPDLSLVVTIGGAFAVRPSEDATGYEQVDGFHGAHPQAADRRRIRKNLSLAGRQQVRPVIPLMLEQVPNVLVRRDAE